jgi:hypothetical protein
MLVSPGSDDYSSLIAFIFLTNIYPSNLTVIRPWNLTSNLQTADYRPQTAVKYVLYRPYRRSVALH